MSKPACVLSRAHVSQMVCMRAVAVTDPDYTADAPRYLRAIDAELLRRSTLSWRTQLELNLYPSATDNP